MTDRELLELAAKAAGYELPSADDHDEIGRQYDYHLGLWVKRPWGWGWFRPRYRTRPRHHTGEVVMTQTTEQSRAENNDCHETFVNKFCPYSGSPDPWLVWQAAWQAARASAVPIHVIELGTQVSESAVKQLVECLRQNEKRFRPITTGLQNIPHGRIDLEPQRQFLLQEERDRRIYIAGPMTGIDGYNFLAFNRAATMLRESGWVVENPADHGVVEGATWSDYLAYGLTCLGACGAVYLLRGWQNSKGAKLEYLIAKELGMVIIEEWS